ncbi:unnamed protein product [Closterium sp. NIES-65]|nr:unnamed protein product [Closterium sp. NIES-65]
MVSKPSAMLSHLPSLPTPPCAERSSLLSAGHREETFSPRQDTRHTYKFGLALAPTSLVTVPAARLQFMPPVTVHAARHCSCRPSLLMPPVTGRAARHWSYRPSLVVPPVTGRAARHWSCRPSLVVPPVTGRAARHWSCRPSLFVPPVTARAARHCSCRPSLLVPPVSARAARHCSCRPVTAPAARSLLLPPVTAPAAPLLFMPPDYHAMPCPRARFRPCSFLPLLVSADSDGRSWATVRRG